MRVKHPGMSAKIRNLLTVVGIVALAVCRGAAASSANETFQGNVTAVPTSPFWDESLGQIAEKYQEIRQMSHLLRTENKNHANKDGSMSKEEQKAYLEKFEVDLVTPEEKAMRERGASNQGYHYLGCAKTFAVMGIAFAEAILEMERPEAKP